MKFNNNPQLLSSKLEDIQRRRQKSPQVENKKAHEAVSRHHWLAK